jgi:hypothetical protein
MVAIIREKAGGVNPGGMHPEGRVAHHWLNAPPGRFNLQRVADMLPYGSTVTVHHQRMTLLPTETTTGTIF